MRIIGLFLILVGFVGFLEAWQMDTTVEAHDRYRVYNIGLMDERRNYLMASGVGIVVGVLLFGFGTLAKNFAAIGKNDESVVPKEIGDGFFNRKSFLQSLTVEFRHVWTAALQQTKRVANYAKYWWVDYRLKKVLNELRFRLGWKMYQSGVGDNGLIQQIAELTKQIEDPAGKTIRQLSLKRERRQLTLRLAGLALAQDSSLDGVETEWRDAKDKIAKAKATGEHLTSLRADLFPADREGWLRVGVGYGMIVAVILIIYILMMLAPGDAGLSPLK